MAEESGDKGAARKEPMIDQSNRPSAIDFDSEISKMKVSDLSALVGAHIEVLKAEKEIAKTEKELSKSEKEGFKSEKEKEIRKPEKEFSKPEKEAFKGEKEKEIRKPEKEFSKPEKEGFKGEKEKEAFKPEGLKPEDKPIDFTIERITEVVLERVMAELQRRGQLR
ncbi:hypothetical protein [Falsiroseomonas sp.]|uniref:hypothetical protein n=1 Tax=Falsiroseomonas sp. TaxID=2870721 RepID=UPI002732E003|nr:hypothetical protein [Falsiroseomonas sp.]MDP3416737.1 hypothetical protein [Falsiroseomonas sp.]